MELFQPEPEIDMEDNPFFAAGLRGQERLKAKYQATSQQAAGLGMGG
jgi:hypothetical protein